jgi:hypothetical protein
VSFVSAMIPMFFVDNGGWSATVCFDDLVCEYGEWE